MVQTASFRPFEVDDLLFINLRDFDRHLFSGMDQCIVNEIMARIKQGEAWTCEYDGKILFFFTIHEYNGMATISLVASEEADKHPTVFALASKNKVDELAEKYRRIQATVHCEYEQSIKWLESMGFEVEGTMRKYDHNGDDYYIMARVR